MLLRDKNAVIYGAGGAIGGAVARAFSREGAKLFLAGRTLAKVEAVAAEISSAGRIAEAAGVDARDEREVESHVEAVVAKCGRIDVLFNAIGMEDIQGTPLIEMPLDDFAHPVVIAATTQFLTARAVARRMVTQGSGAILSVTAEPAREVASNIGGFCVACSAIEGLWRTLAAELGPYGVRVVCLRSAGSPETADLQHVFKVHAEAAGRTFEEQAAQAGGGTLLGRLSTLAEVADVATIMASDRASAITGSFINVTCGSPVD